MLYKNREFQYKNGTVVQYSCATYISEIAFAIEKCISYLLSTYKYIFSGVAKLFSDQVFSVAGHRSGALFVALSFLFLLIFYLKIRIIANFAPLSSFAARAV